MAGPRVERFDETTNSQIWNFSKRSQRRTKADMREDRQLAHGRIGYISEVLGCSTKTLNRGMKDLDELSNDPADSLWHWKRRNHQPSEREMALGTPAIL